MRKGTTHGGTQDQAVVELNLNFCPLYNTGTILVRMHLWCRGRAKWNMKWTTVLLPKIYLKATIRIIYSKWGYIAGVVNTTLREVHCSEQYNSWIVNTLSNFNKTGHGRRNASFKERCKIIFPDGPFIFLAVVLLVALVFSVLELLCYSCDKKEPGITWTAIFGRDLVSLTYKYQGLIL